MSKHIKRFVEENYLGHGGAGMRLETKGVRYVFLFRKKGRVRLEYSGDRPQPYEGDSFVFLPNR